MSSMEFSEAVGKVEGAWETAGQVYFEDLTGTNSVPVSAPGENKASTDRNCTEWRHIDGMDGRYGLGSRRLARMAAL